MANPWDTEIHPDLQPKSLSGADILRNLGQFNRGVAQVPAGYYDLSGMAYQGLSWLTKQLFGEGAASRTLEAGATDAAGAAKTLSGIADKLVPVGEPTDVQGRMSRALGRGALDPLNFIGGGPGFLKAFPPQKLAPAVGVSGAVGEAATPAPEAHAPAPDQRSDIESLSVTTSYPWDAPAYPWDSSVGTLEKYGIGAGLGAAAAIAAAALLRRLRPSLSAQTTRLADPAAAVSQRESATLPGEVVQGIQTDISGVTEKQFARSMAGRPEAPMGNLDPMGESIYAAGRPVPGTVGAEHATLYRPGMGMPPTRAPHIADPPVPASATPGEVKALYHEKATVANPYNAQKIAEEFKATGAWELPDHTVVRTKSFNSIADQIASTGTNQVVNDIAALEQALDLTLKSKSRSAPMLTNLLGTREMTTLASGLRIPNVLRPGAADGAKIRAAEQMLRALRTMNPNATRLVDELKEVAQFVLKSGEKYGMPPRLIQKFMQVYPRFLPLRERGDIPAPGTWGRFMHTLRQVGSVDSELSKGIEHFETVYLRRNPLHGRSVQVPENFVESMERYITNAVHSFHRNDAKRTFFYGIRNSPEFQKSFSTFAWRDRNKGGAKDAVWFWDGNIKLGVVFEDALAHHAFKFLPSIKPGIWQAIRRVWQQSVTGIGNPFFIPARGVFYDVGAGTLLRPAGSRLSVGVLGRLLPGRLNTLAGADVTAGLEATWKGAKEVLGLRRVERHAMEVERAIAVNSDWYRNYEALKGPGSTRKLAEQLWQSRIDHDYAFLARRGVVGLSQYIETALKEGMSRVEQAVPLWRSQGHPPSKVFEIFNGYKNIMEGIANANRILYFRQNKPRPYAAIEAGELVGQFSRRGAGRIPGTSGSSIKVSPESSLLGTVVARAAGSRVGQGVAQGFLQQVPYSNVFIQTARRGFDMLRKHPLEVTGGIVAGVMGPSILSALQLYYDSEAREYWMRQPGYVRASTRYFRIPGLPVEHGLKIPVAPDPFFGPMHSTTFYAMAELLGLNDKAMVGDDIKDALAATFGVFVPIQAQVLLPLFGHEAQSRGTSYQDLSSAPGAGLGSSLSALGVPVPGIRKIDPERVTGSDKLRPGALLPANWEKFGEGLLGQLFSLGLGGAEAVSQAFKEDRSPAASFTEQLSGETLKRTPLLAPVHGFHVQPAMTNIKRRLGEKNQVIEQITNAVDSMMGQPASGQRGWALRDLQLSQAQIPDWWSDPVKQRRALNIKIMFDLDPALRAMKAQRNALREELMVLRGKRPLVEKDRVRLNSVQLEELGIVDKMYDQLKSKEKQLGFQIEDTFK